MLHSAGKRIQLFQITQPPQTTVFSLCLGFVLFKALWMTAILRQDAFIAWRADCLVNIRQNDTKSFANGIR